MMSNERITHSAWIGGLIQRETMPVLEAALSFAQQRQLTIGHNIANVNTPYYKREVLADDDFRSTLSQAIREREEQHWNRFEPRPSGEFGWEQNFVQVRRQRPGMDRGPERHDENNVVIEHEMAELQKNTLYMQTLQQLYKKHTSQLKTALRDRLV